MQKTMKKTLSIILAILMIVTTVPFAFAADETPPTREIDGEVYYELDSAEDYLWFVQMCNESVDIDNPDETIDTDDGMYPTEFIYHIPHNAILTGDIIINNNVIVDGELTADTSSLGTVDPIANYEAEKMLEGRKYNTYTGTFDGNGYSISGLYMNSSEYKIAMFRNVHADGVIKNLHIKDSYIEAKSNSAGIVVKNKGTVSGCSYDGIVYSKQMFAGGLVSSNYGLIEKSYNAAHVHSGGHVNAGIVSTNYGTIRECFNIGIVGDNVKAYQTGGIVGSNNENGIVENCFNNGIVLGSNMIGGIAYNAGSGSLTKNCYFNTDKFSGNAIAYGNNGVSNVEGKTTEEFESGAVCDLVGYHTYIDDVCAVCGCMPEHEHTTEKQTCMGYRCIYCGIYHGEAAPDNHEYKDYTVVNPATCKEEGLEKASCIHCNGAEIERAIPKAEHDWSNKDGICAAGCGETCIHTGWYNGKCSTCDYVCTHPEWNGKICAVCSSECAHPEYIYGICSICKTPCTHSYRSGRCVYCLTECDHSDFADGRCKTCNMVGGALSDNINWYYDGMSGWLVIAGTGDMPVFSNAPWSSYKDTINVIAIREGITSVSANAFPDNTRVTSIILPKTLTTIEEFAFIGCENVSRLILPSGVTTLNANAVNYMSTIHYLGERDSITIIGDLVPALHCCIKTAEEKEATCTENGTTETWYCETCNSQIEGGAVIPASHKTVEVEAKAPTCTEIGWDAYEYCTACDYTTYAEIPVDADAHDWSNKDGVCANGCGLECAHEDAYNNLIRPVQNADGTWGKGKIVKICNTCGNSSLVQEVERDHEGYAAFEKAAEELEALLNSGKMTDKWKNDYTNSLNGLRNSAYYQVYTEIETAISSMTESLKSIIAAIEAGFADGTMKKADFTYMTALFDEINALIDNDPNKLIPSESGRFQGIYYGYYMSCKNNDNHSQFDYDQNMAGNNWEGQIEEILAGIKDGTMLKADYTAIDEAIAEIEKKLADENLTDEAKAELEEIKSQLEEMKADGNTSAADLAELEKALEDYETELDAGIADGTAVKVDGFTVYTERGREWLLKFADEGIFEKARELILNSTEVKAKMDEIYDFALSLEGNVAENAENIAKIEADVDEFFGQLKKCIYGIHNVSQYKEISPAKCGENAVESATCTLCGETVTREVENSALTHSFTKYEETEAPKCGVEGKEVAYCDNGCGETDEKAIEALKHSFTKYEEIEAPECGVEGKEVATCDHGCGETDEKAIAALTHTDTDGDYICDNGCGHEFEKPAPEEPTPDTPDEPEEDNVCADCGKVHTNFFSEIICFFTRIINFIKNLFA